MSEQGEVPAQDGHPEALVALCQQWLSSLEADPVRPGARKQKRCARAPILTKPWVETRHFLPYFLFSPFQEKKRKKRKQKKTNNNKKPALTNFIILGRLWWTKKPGLFKVKLPQRRCEDTALPVAFLSSLPHASSSPICSGMLSCLIDGQSKQAEIVWWDSTDKRKHRKQTIQEYIPGRGHHQPKL